MKKFCLVLLALCCLFTFCACAKTDAPDGMKDVAHENARFHLYVPDAWTSTSDSGISGAKASDGANVTLTLYLPDTPLSPAGYFDASCRTSYSENFKDYTLLTDGADAKLGGKDAKEYVFSLTMDGKLYQLRQILATHGNYIYILTYTAPADLYAAHTEEVDSIAANFVFR